jgi:hypothetical protein
MEFDGFGEDQGAGPLAPADEELVGRTLRDIDGRSSSDREVLLSALLCAAWPAPRSQMQ